MKSLKFYGLLMVLASAFLFVHCTSDLPEPIQGPPGIDGSDGRDGQDGVSGTASCVSCHNNTLRGEIAAAFDISAHGSGSVSFAEGRTAGNCASCHGNDGFVDFIETGAAPGPYSFRSPIDCNTCHSSHQTFDFENDGPDYALRNPEPTELVLAPSITLDFGDASNNCISCHQPRPSYEIPALNASGTYAVGTTRFGPHHGPQSTVLEGILGAEIPGSVAYPASGTATHRTASTCVQCHMGDSSDPATGGHTWTPIEENCIECHQAVPGEANGYTQDMSTLLALLMAVEGQAVELDSEQEPVLDANGELIPAAGTVTGILQANGRSNYGIFSDVAAMAAWNYKTALEDQSRGIHNPEYTKALLKNSIEALQNEN